MKKETSVLIKLSEDEKVSFQRAAELEGLGFSAWARQLLRKEATKVLKNNGETPRFLKKD